MEDKSLFCWKISLFSAVSVGRYGFAPAEECVEPLHCFWGSWGSGSRGNFWCTLLILVLIALVSELALVCYMSSCPWILIKKEQRYWRNVFQFPVLIITIAEYNALYRTCWTLRTEVNWGYSSAFMLSITESGHDINGYDCENFDDSNTTESRLCMPAATFVYACAHLLGQISWSRTCSPC